MYRSCIFCSAPLGSNDFIERFPVGRSLAFDGEKGRLWAVCGKCARWNLAPVEERWEAIEDAERLFRDTRLRVQRENIGLARLRDGTRLIRVGQALAGEVAVWRYGATLSRRRTRWLMRTIPVTIAGSTVLVLSMPAGIVTYAAWQIADLAVTLGGAAMRRRALVFETRDEDGSRVRVYGRQLTRLRLGGETDELELHIPTSARGRAVPGAPLVLRGLDARMALGRAMVAVNAKGASRRAVRDALGELQDAGSARELLGSAAERRVGLDGNSTPLMFSWSEVYADAATPRAYGPPVSSVALEMALHEETERRALQGELAMLQAMWRDAEEIAGIADRLPDLPAPEPPRLSPEG